MEKPTLQHQHGGLAGTPPEVRTNVSCAVCTFTYLLVLKDNHGFSSHLCFPNHFKCVPFAETKLELCSEGSLGNVVFRLPTLPPRAALRKGTVGVSYEQQPFPLPSLGSFPCLLAMKEILSYTINNWLKVYMSFYRVSSNPKRCHNYIFHRSFHCFVRLDFFLDDELDQGHFS